MNVYWVDGGLVEHFQYDPPDYESFYARGIFCAETPSQAKYDALREFAGDVDWLDLRARLLVRNVALPRGVFDEECPEGPWQDGEARPPDPWGSVWEALDALLALGTEVRFVEVQE